MKPNHIIIAAVVLSTGIFMLRAGPRTSAYYSVATDTADSGGTRSTSATYTHDGSLGVVVGISTVATPAETAKHGYIGQLYEVTGLALGSAESELDEGTTLQLAAWHSLDDATFLALPATAVNWLPDGNFPLTVNGTTGLATAVPVYQNTDTTVSATQGAIPNQLTAELDLTVLNTLPDNYPGYDGDLLDDDWQVGYFGAPPNVNAGPLMDPDGDSQDNRFEFTAGLNPIDPLSRFLVSIAPVPGQPGQKNVTFEPMLSGRSYVVKTSPDLSPASWATLLGGSISDNGSQRTVTDTNASESKKFYRVEIVKP